MDDEVRQPVTTAALLERDDELDVLETALRRATAGSGSVVLLSGGGPHDRDETSGTDAGMIAPGWETTAAATSAPTRAASAGD